MQQDHDFTTEDLQTLNPTNSSAVQASMEAVKNPVKACRQMHEYIGELNSSLREKAASNDAERKIPYVIILHVQGLVGRVPLEARKWHLRLES